MCVFSAIGAYQQAKSQQAMADYQADLADVTQQQYNRLALDTTEQGEWEKRNLGLQQLSALGDARATMASSGAQMGSGSSLDYEASFADVSDMDMRQMNYDIQSRAYEARMGAWQAGNQANMFRAQSDAYGQQAGWALGGGLADAGISLGFGITGAAMAGAFDGLFSSTGGSNWSFGMGSGGFSSGKSALTPGGKAGNLFNWG